LLAVNDFFAGLPGAKLNFEINFIWLALAYAVLAAIAHKIKEREKEELIKF